MLSKMEKNHDLTQDQASESIDQGDSLDDNREHVEAAFNVQQEAVTGQVDIRLPQTFS